MPLVVPDANGALTLEGTASVGGKTYRVLAQRTPTPDPLVGVALSDREGELYLGGARAPMFGVAGWSVAQGQAVRLTLRASALAARVGQGRYWIALLAGDGVWTWRVAASWEVEVDFRPFPVYAYTSRLPNGMGVVLVVTPLEGPERAELTLGDVRLSQTWSGFRRRRDGAPGFAFTLPREASGEGVVQVYRRGRYGQARFRLDPWPASPSERTVKWRLPFWLPAGQLPLAHLLEAVGQALPDGESMAAQVNPDRAQGRFLPIHAALFAATPDLEESEDLLRLRLKAIPRGYYASIPALRAHLKALTQGGVAVSDASSIEGRPVKLDGTWRLDGTQVLGGDPGLAVGPGRYLVRFYDAPLPWPYYWKELARLRPAGLEPVLWQDVGGGIVRLGVQVGAKETGLGPYRDVPLPEYRRVDGTWMLDGTAYLASGMVVRGAVVASPEAEVGGTVQGPDRDIVLARYRRVDGTWMLDGTAYLASGMVVRGAVVASSEMEAAGWAVPLARYRRVDGTWMLDGTAYLASGMVVRGAVVASPEAEVGGTVQGPDRDIVLARYRRVDGTWMLDGTAYLASGMVVRGAVVASPEAEVGGTVQGPDRDIVLARYRRVDGTWMLDGTAYLASGMVVRGAVVASPEAEVGGTVQGPDRDIVLARYRRVDGTWMLDGTAYLASGMVVRGAVVASPEAEVGGTVQGPDRDIVLARYRRVDGTWMLDGTAYLASGMVVRGAVVASPEAEVGGTVQGPDRDIVLARYRRVDGTWMLDGTAYLASGMVVRGAVVAS